MCVFERVKHLMLDSLVFFFFLLEECVEWWSVGSLHLDVNTYLYSYMYDVRYVRLDRCVLYMRMHVLWKTVMCTLFED